ncbi:Rhodanese-related sulfurtransferase [Schinkia azotoformans MEV2011]|uniref:Rhodanese-related sulfurtransferase n=1 Tax=Schinkia azotoformans MEV2011 TaxID=1348973 RepID=A0A072NHH2_SCHAZ|nr:rhodanese-like domain-containing protein [Schinkia azotoformans]KEF37119.1 Rhodanese-related sulfurtransferase [Schinkia azotoformans MEV2011]MEC1694338.1 rhodanese-like domain-containing protein [Schinkia azotoformans]MEC1717971.1 rhodanese-like domain-containing protein [Schinkia azotoformans]MEC1723379.1 rhodanese-like domain-containing protein [Schinkia azotoformans]MEC1743289.1 rhodanese-like domain-containing protein [Schinkia azotoformans]
MSNIEYFKSRVDSTFSPMDYLQAKKMNPDKYVLIDVRNGTPELKKEKISGSLEIPQPEIINHLSELPKDKEIIVYCWDVWCNTASKSAIVLLENGFSVRELSGGIASWKTLNLPTTSLLESNNECGC